MSVEDLQVFLDRYTKCKIQDNISVTRTQYIVYYYLRLI